MATGFEVAGLVLTTFPIIVKALTAYADGVRTIKFWRRYRRELESYARRLRTQKVRYINTLELLFEGIVESEEELATLINDPIGVSWRDSKHNKALRFRLDYTYDHFFDILNFMMDTLQELGADLGVDEVGNLNWDIKSSVEREMKRIGLVFSRGTITETLNTIEKCNQDLQDLTRLNEELGPVRQRRRSKCPHERLREIRKYARSLFNSLVRGKSWTCSCRNDHTVHLQLQPRPSKPHVRHEDDEKALTFRVLMSRSTTSSCTQKGKLSDPHWDWKEVTIQTLEVDILHADAERSERPHCILADNEITQDSATRRPPEAAGKRTRFLNVDSRPRHRPQQLHDLDSIAPSGKPITDMCAALVQDQWPGQRIGHVAIEEFTEHYLILFQGNKVEAKSVECKLTLTDLLSNAMQSEKPFSLSRRQRLSIASTLASSVLQLDMTLWLNHFWTSNQIVFHCPSDCTSLGSSVYPYISGQVRPIKGSNKEQHDSRSVESSNETLLSLGITLIELCFGQPVSEMRKPEDVGSDETVTKIRSAKRLLSQVYDEAGCRYGDAVKQCLESHQDFPDATFEDKKFQEAVYTTIVMPLAQDLDDFEGRYLSSTGRP